MLALVLALLPANPANAAHEGDPDQGHWTCRASVLRIEDVLGSGTNIEPFVASDEDDPTTEEIEEEECTDEQSGLLSIQDAGPITSLEVVNAETENEQGTEDDDFPGEFAEAHASVVEVKLNFGDQLFIEADVLTAHAFGGPCPSTELTGESEVLRVRVDDDNNKDNGEIADIDVIEDHEHIDLGPLGTLHLEHDESDDNQHIERAVFFEHSDDSPLRPLVGDVIISEAIVDVHGNPCDGEEGEDRFAGFFTGGGFVAEPGSNRDHNDEGEVDPGTVAHHAFALDCFEEEGVDPRPGKDNLVVQWFDEDNNEHASVKLTELEDTRCFFDEEEGDASPPASEFNTIEGSGLARCRTRVLGEPMEFDAEVEFRFTDEGEPGRNNDEAHIEVTSPHPMAPIFCNFTSDGLLDGGNHQAHQLPSQAGGNDNNGGSNANRF